MANEAMVSLDDVSFSYQGAPETVHQVSFQVGRGECCVLLGASGSGKTTITRLVNGLAGDYYRGATAGRVFLDGHEAQELASWQRSQLVGSVFQDPSSQFFSSQPAGEVAFGCENLGFDHEAVVGYTDEAMSTLAIDDLREQRIDLLSSGQKQKIAIASALAPQSPTLVLDEPSANLDEPSSFELGRTLRALKQRGYTLVVAEHRIAYLMDVADAFYYVSDGAIQTRLTREDIHALSSEERLTMGIRSPVRVKRPRLDAPGTLTETDSSSTPGELLKVEGLGLAYKEKCIFERLSFRLFPGQVLAVTGRNGAGKTSLARVLAGLRKPQGGIITIGGTPLKSRELRRKVWYSSNDTSAEFFTASVADEVMLMVEQSDENISHARTVLDMLGLYGMKDRHPAALSGGQKQRLSIACGLVSKRPVIILDEPTSGLDSINMSALANAIGLAAEQGHAVIVITHDNEFMNACCSHMLVLDDEHMAQ